jgi:hypothetical protein
MARYRSRTLGAFAVGDWNGWTRMGVTAGGVLLTAVGVLWRIAVWQGTTDAHIIGLGDRVADVSRKLDLEDAGRLQEAATIATQLALIQTMQKELEHVIRSQEYYHGVPRP